MKGIHIATRLILCGMIVLLMTRAGQAFHISEEMNTENFSLRYPNNTHKNRSNGMFVLYDNFRHSPEGHRQEPVIFPRSDHFVPADLIDCNIPVHTVFHHTENIGDPLSNLLYANLRLKKLLDEYQALQESIREILADLGASSGAPGPDVPGLIRKVGAERVDTKDSLSELTRKSTPSVHKTWEKLRRELATHTKNVRLSALSEKNSDSLVLSNAGDVIPLNIPHTGARPRSSGYSADTHLETGKRRPAPDSSYSAQRIRTSRSSSSPGKRDAKHFDGEDDFVTWLLNMPEKIVSYMISNKIETVVYGAVLILVINGILWIRSRQN